MVLFTLWMFLSSVSAYDFDVHLQVDRMIETRPSETLELGWSITTEGRDFNLLFMHGNETLAEIKLRGGVSNTVKPHSRITYRHPAVNHHVIHIEKVVPEDAGFYYMLIDDLDGSRGHEERRYGEIEVVVDGQANIRHSTSRSIMTKVLISSLCGTILLVAILIVVVGLWRRAKQNRRGVERQLGQSQRQVDHGNEYTEPTYCDVRESCMVADNDIIRESPQVPDWDDPTYSRPFENTRNIFSNLDNPKTESPSKGKALARSASEVVGCRPAMMNQAKPKSLSMRNRFMLDKFPNNMESEYLKPLNERSNALNKSKNLTGEDDYLLPIEQRTLTLPHNYRATGIFPDEVCIVKVENSTATGSKGYSSQGYKPAYPLKTTDGFDNTNRDQVEDAYLTTSFKLVDTYLTTSLEDACLTNVSNDSKRMASNEEQASTIKAMKANFERSNEDVNKENGANNGVNIEQQPVSNDKINPTSSKWKISCFSKQKKSKAGQKHISGVAQDWHQKSLESKTLPMKSSKITLESKEDPESKQVEGKSTDPSQLPQDGTVRDLLAKFNQSI